MVSISLRAWSMLRPSARAISKYLPWRTSAMAAWPKPFSAERTVCPCGSSTVDFRVTNTRAFMEILNYRMAGHRHIGGSESMRCQPSSRLTATSLGPHRAGQFDSPDGAALEERAFHFEEAGSFPAYHPNVRIRGLFADDR